MFDWMIDWLVYFCRQVYVLVTGWWRFAKWRWPRWITNKWWTCWKRRCWSPWRWSRTRTRIPLGVGARSRAAPTPTAASMANTTTSTAMPPTITDTRWTRLVYSATNSFSSRSVRSDLMNNCLFEWMRDKSLDINTMDAVEIRHAGRFVYLLESNRLNTNRREWITFEWQMSWIDWLQTKRYSNGEGRVSATRQTAAQQRVASVNSRRMRYERSVSPPRSSSSSGYGTGSSSRSFTAGGQNIPAASTPPILKDRFPTNPEGTLTSTSSGHSSDDPWYDLMPDINDTDPPPLPLRQGPERLRGPRPVGSHPSHSADSSPNKKTTTTTTTMPTYSTPPKPKSLLESPILVGRMNNYEDIRSLDRGGAGPQEASKPDTGAKGRPANPPDYHHAMQSRLVALKSSSVDTPMPSMHNKSPSFASRSEDELSAGSTNSLSPHSRRRHNKNTSVDTLTPTSGNSRNQSPRLLVEAKLKSTGSLCSGSSGSNKNSQRCSSNLQEDLLRLITPDEEVVTRALPVACVLSNESTSETPVPNVADEDMDWSRLVDAAARAIQGALYRSTWTILSKLE